MTLIDPATVHRRTLRNGLRVLARRDASAPVVAIVTYVNAGYFDETDDVVGIAHVLEHMFFKGTPTRGVGEIARQTKAAGGYLNAATIYDHTLYYAVAPSSGFRAALDVQADAYRNSLIDAGELRKELEVIIEEAKRKLDNPPAVAIESLYELLHDRHRIRRWRIGREDGLRKLSREHLVGFYRNFYQPANTVLAIVGDIEHERMFDEVERAYGDIPAGQPIRSAGPGENGTTGFRYRELAGDIAQSQIAFGWRTPGTLHPDSPGLDMLATVFGAGRASRLYRATRERKLVSDVGVYNYTPRDIGVFAVHAESPIETMSAACDAIWHEIRKLRDGRIDAVELDRARRITESRWVRRLEDMEGQANFLAEWEALGEWELGARYYESLLAVTASDLESLADRYLAEDAAGLLVYRPRAAPELAASASEIRNRLAMARTEPLEQTKAVDSTAPAARAREPEFIREEAGVHVFRLPSGVPVLVRQRPGSPIWYAGVFALGGASQEDAATGGRTLLAARTAVKGTRLRSAVQIAEASEMLGGSISPAVGGDSFGWSISVPAAHAATALALLADVVQYAAFPEYAIETERAIAIAEVQSLRDDMYRYPMRLVTQAAFAGHPYGVPATGTDESLRSLSRQHLVDWHAERFLEGSTVVAVVGPDDPHDSARLVASVLHSLSFREGAALAPAPWPAGPVMVGEERDKKQTALTIAWPAPQRSDMARYDVAMLAGIASGLGGRFFEELRDKQSLCYTVQAFGHSRRAAGTFNCYIATSPEKEDAARGGLLAEVARFRDARVTDEELERARTYAIGAHAIRQQSGGAVLGEMVEAWMFGTLAELTTFERDIRGVSAEGIIATARRYLDPERRVEGVVRGRAV